MIQAAKKALTPQQIEEYKRIGEHMYSNTDYHLADVNNVRVKDSNPTDLLIYATQALRAGGDPKDLTEKELSMLVGVYGDKWYEKFDLDENDIPKQVNSIDEAINEVKRQMKDKNLSRQQRRMLERRLNKEKDRMNKDK